MNKSPLLPTFEKYYTSLKKCSITFSIVLLSGIVSTVFAQEYTVSHDSTTYTPLTIFDVVDETNPELDAIGDELYNNIPIGFEFNFEGESFDSLKVSESGYVMFNTEGIANGYISIFDCPLENFDNMPDVSPIVYSTSGIVGERIFILEYVNVGFVNDSENNDSANFQLWLYENCSDFEIHIGPSSIEAEEMDLFYNMNPAPIMGYGNYILFTFYQLSGAITSPEILTTGGASLESLPPSGAVYHFTKCSVGIENHNDTEFTIYPNPTSGVTSVQFNNSNKVKSIQIFNIQGQVVQRFAAPSTKELNVDFSAYNKGIYFIQVSNENSVITKKVLNH